MKYSPLATSAILLAVLSTPAIAENDVDFSTTHFFTQELDKNYVIDALTPHSLARWNYDSPVGTPVTINYAFAGEEIGYVTASDVKRDFYQYEKDAILEELDGVASFTNITFVEVSDVYTVNIIFYHFSIL